MTSARSTSMDRGANAQSTNTHHHGLAKRTRRADLWRHSVPSTKENRQKITIYHFTLHYYESKCKAPYFIICVTALSQTGQH